MARPTKATIDYFPHYVDESDSLKAIQIDFGNDGYVFWFKLLQKLGKTQHHFFDIQEGLKFKLFCDDCRVSTGKGLEILDKLAEVGSIHKKLWEQKIIISENFLENAKEAYSRRLSDFWDIVTILNYLTSICRISGVSVSVSGVSVCNNSLNSYSNPQRKVKESKGKESITTTSTSCAGEVFENPTEGCEFEELRQPYGFYQKVFLSKQEYLELEGYSASSALVSQVIEELDANIAEGKVKGLEEENHYPKLRKYIDFRRKNPDKFIKGRGRVPPRRGSPIDFSKFDFTGEHKNE